VSSAITGTRALPRLVPPGDVIGPEGGAEVGRRVALSVELGREPLSLSEGIGRR